MSKKSYFIIFCASLVILLSMGMRQSFGLFQTPISQSFGIGIAAFSLSLAVQNLIWGLSQPLIGALSDKFGSGKVIGVSAVLQVLGLLMLANAETVWELHVSTGIILGISGSGLTWAVILSVVARNVPEKRRTLFFGITSSIGTGGQILIAPLNQFTINAFGWVDALIVMAFLMAIILPLSLILTGRAGDLSPDRERADSLLETLNLARRHSGYLYLTAGFFVCGFQVMFIMAHLPTYLMSLDMPAWLPGTTISTIGATNLIGTFLFGWLGDKYSKKYLLSFLYFSRSLVFAIFLLVPPSPTSVLIFGAALGFLWLATVPLTSALVGHFFGLRYLATLAGIVFASHQLGSFTSIWLGGLLYDTTGSYTVVWQIAIALGVAAALIHLPIKEEPSEDQAPQPAG